MRTHTSWFFASLFTLAATILAGASAAQALSPTPAPQCSDGVDNDGDGLTDALVELPVENGQTIHVGGRGNSTVVRDTVLNLIRTKHLPFTEPVDGRGSKLLRADSPYRGNNSYEGGTLDLTTLNQVCRILGYRTYVNSTCQNLETDGKCNYYSPGDNDMWRFRNGNFQKESATYKSWIATIDCKNRLAACSDGWDNDGDGAVDMADSGCASPNDDSEKPHDPVCTSPSGTTEVPQCSDGVDNDGDGAKDFPADFSCSSANDLDETNPKSQCQNGLDDDSDGAVDLADPGCGSAQDNNEGDEPARLAVSVECVMANSDGTKTAFFSYNNATTETLIVPTGSTGTSLLTNSFDLGGADRGQPTSFLPGVHRGVVAVPVTGAAVTWTVRGPLSAISEAEASLASPPCSQIEPIFECQGYSGGNLRAKGSYRNTNGFDIVIPYGPLNSISPGTANQGQPSTLRAGFNQAAFSLGFAGTPLVWDLNGRRAIASNSLPICDGECIDTPIGADRDELDQIAIQLAKITKDAADILAAAGDSSQLQGTARKASRRRAAAADARNRVDAERAKAKADEYVRLSRQLSLQFPDVVKNCPDAPLYCSTVDRGESIDQLKALYAVARNHAQRTIARAYFVQTGSTNRKDKLVKKAKELERRGIAKLDLLPRTETVCK